MSAWKQNERAVAVAFSRWLTDGKCSTVLARMPLQGRNLERLTGDLHPHPDCPPKWRPRATWFMESFYVDAKRRKDFALTALAAGGCPRFWRAWAKTQDNARHKVPLMVCLEKQTRLVVGPQPTDYRGPALRVTDGTTRVWLTEIRHWLAAGEPESWGWRAPGQESFLTSASPMPIRSDE